MEENDTALVVPKEVALVSGSVDVSDISLTGKEAEEATGIKAQRFFPFLQLVQRTSQIIEQGHSAGTFIFKRSGQDQKPQNLGDSFLAFVVSARAKAIYWNKAESTVDNQYKTAKFGPSERFEEYRDKANSNPSLGNPYRSGLEILFWLPELGTFATYFANTPSTTASAEQAILPYLGFAVKVKSDPRKNKKGSWFVAIAEEMDRDEWEQQSQPTKDEYKNALNLFLYPPVSTEEASNDSVVGAEKADEPAVARER